MPKTHPVSSPVYARGSEKAAQVRAMFSAIAPRYDVLNHLLSLNLDRRWRRRAVDRLAWERAPAGVYLDACSGTFDLALELARRPAFTGAVLGVDFSGPMLRQGLRKIAGTRVRPVCADALDLPFPDRSLDGAMVAFGIRNLADLTAGFRELSRVLRRGARLVVLEFATPARGPWRGVYLLYFRRVLPVVGRWISQHNFAYRYLPESVLLFESPEELGDTMRSAGFEGVAIERLTGGAVALLRGERA
ncbi:MAG: ubiquinone/menaquinone biosynthesis methyltransferase [Gemmatimonadetes bacterium]|nr:ubiquinone/menaquinone biosynthesis methyltransferase [Gemmatimonadota bacterium]